MQKTTQLKRLLHERKLLQAPGAYDVLSARIIEMAGFDAVYMTGYGTSASVLGQPDVGLLTASEMAERLRNIVAAVSVPVIVDGDTGFGNPLNVTRTVQLYEQAGAAAIQLEDQVFPKRCGHMLGRRVIPTAEMIQKIKAACEARRDKDFVVIARTDARTNHGIEEALKRGKAYAEAGADVLFDESPESVAELEQINKAFPNTPTLANMIEGGRTPFLPAQQLEALGFAVALYPTGPLYVAVKAVKAILKN
jgi:2-methylisocitrate lyase-like PEP mutase family enzyme